MAEPNYFRITSLEDNNVIALTKTGTPSAVSLQYRTDLNQVWQPYPIGTELTLFRDSWIEFRNTTGTFSTSQYNYYKFTSTKTFNVSGKIGSLLYYTMDTITASVNYAFYRLFDGSMVVDASNLDMNLQIVGQYGCGFMFASCTRLLYAPRLPAATISTRSYTNMFEVCSAMVKAADLPAKTVPDGAYNGMYQVCTSLVNGPSIGADAFTGSNNMYAMFNGSTKMTSLTWTGSKFNGYSYFSKSVPNSGVFYYTDKNLNVSAIPRNTSGIPAGWRIEYLAPKPPLVFSINGKAVKALTINGKSVAKLG